MSRNNPLDILIEQSKKKRDSASKTLAESRQKKQQIEQQIAALSKYRDEYQQQLQSTLSSGTNTAILDNYRRFIASLEEAITQSTHNLSDASHKVQTNSEHWRAKQKRLSSFNLLAEQRTQKLLNKQAKLEQKLNDEFNTITQARKMAEQRDE